MKRRRGRFSDTLKELGVAGGVARQEAAGVVATPPSLERQTPELRAPSRRRS